MSKMNVIVDQLIVKTLNGEVKWSCSYDDGYTCDTKLSDGTRIGIVHLNNFLDILAHADMYFHIPDGNILSHSVNGFKCARLIKAIIGNPMSVDSDHVGAEKERVAIDKLLEVLK
ncbi:MAG: hypothetical protein Q8N61_00880 [bacterium]|nr:hypothetical protein [bacterium]